MEEIDPKWTRVSNILSMIPSVGEDGKWSFPMNEINPDILQKKADLGTAVHSAIAAHTKDEFYVLSYKEASYLKSFLAWEKEVGLAWSRVEKRLYYEPMLLTGCIDMVGMLKNSSSWQIIDFKCAAAPDVKKWPIQGALYYLLCTENGLYVDNRVVFVQLDAKGKLPKVHEFEITKELMAMAISLYNLYVYLTKK
jgi:hypothetical protein